MQSDETTRVLVVAAHPDDPDFGCAGTMALWAKQGKEIYYLLSTRGDKGSNDRSMTSERLAPLREQEQRAAAAIVGVKEVSFLDLKDGELMPDLRFRGEVTKAIRKYRPYAVFTHDPTVVINLNLFLNHPDHRATGQATLDAIYPTARDHLQFPEQVREGLEPHKVTEIYLFGSFEPNFWVDITETIEKKIEALSQHKTQFADFEAVASRVRERARLAGQSQGVAYAEAFRRIIMGR